MRWCSLVLAGALRGIFRSFLPLRWSPIGQWLPVSASLRELCFQMQHCRPLDSRLPQHTFYDPGKRTAGLLLGRAACVKCGTVDPIDPFAQIPTSDGPFHHRSQDRRICLGIGDVGKIDVFKGRSQWLHPLDDLAQQLWVSGAWENDIDKYCSHSYLFRGCRTNTSGKVHNGQPKIRGSFLEENLPQKGLRRRRMRQIQW